MTQYVYLYATTCIALKGYAVYLYSSIFRVCIQNDTDIRVNRKTAMFVLNREHIAGSSPKLINVTILPCDNLSNA